ncbi:hypothetical protein ILUMI_20550 [Ignelater luminosus]|uniref:PiggyBac transposable element-derived protein domain-containing protein n=1 Tax=Ignelater luminosus TaxID=2038154 RepID=A0A8K0CE23_IGNLU|nr:hypothetical protein ILUMI_20550 [Ignelater luminosus]
MKNLKMRQQKVKLIGKQLSISKRVLQFFDLLWRGKLVFRQYIQNKCRKYGVKFYMLTEPSGLILKFAVDIGALDEYGGRGHASKIVLHLMNEKLIFTIIKNNSFYCNTIDRQKGYV